MVEILDYSIPILQFNYLAYFIKNKEIIQNNMFFCLQQMKGSINIEYLENKEIPEFLDFIHKTSEFLDKQAKALNSKNK